LLSVESVIASICLDAFFIFALESA
jgi:hypothetical protein